MRAVAGHLTLSPSDFNDYVECAHLTTLALEVAKGSSAPARTSPTSRPSSCGARARSTSAPFERLRAEGRAIVEIDLGEP